MDELPEPWPEIPLEDYFRRWLDEAHGAVDESQLMRTDDVHDMLLDIRRALNRHVSR